MHFAAESCIVPRNESPPWRNRSLELLMPVARRRSITVYVNDDEYAALDDLRRNLGIKVSLSALAQFSLRTFLERYKNKPVQLLLELKINHQTEATEASDDQLSGSNRRE
jgi:hypothetical protein